MLCKSGNDVPCFVVSLWRFPSPCSASRGMTSLFFRFPWRFPSPRCACRGMTCVVWLRLPGNDVCGMFFCFCVFLFCSAIQNLPYAARQILHLHLFVRDYKLSKYLSNSEILCLASAEPLAAALVQASRALA